MSVKAQMCLKRAEKKLTTDAVNKAIVTYNKKNLAYRLTVCSEFLILSAVILLVLYCGSPFDNAWTLCLEVLCISVLVLIPSVCLLLFFLENRGIAQGKYTVSNDKVERVARGDRRVYKLTICGVRRFPEDVMYLENTRRVVIPERDIDTYSEDDRLYLVVRKKCPTKPLFIYNSKYYELTDTYE